MPIQRPLIFHGWFIVAAGVVSYAVGYGARYSFAVVFPYLLEEFHWPRDTTAAVIGVHTLMYGLFAPLAGRFVERIGPRRTMVSGALVLSLGLALSGLGSDPWHFYVTFGCLTGAGLSLVGAVPFVTILRNWFERRRGLVFSLLFLGAGGSYAWYPVVASLIEAYGWRWAFVVEAAVVGAVLVPLFILIVRYHPRDMGLRVDGVLEEGLGATGGPPEERVVDPAWTEVDWTLGRAARTGRFWLICVASFFLWGIAQQLMVTHHVAFAADVGYSKVGASSILSLFGLAYLVGSLSAFVSDRIGREWTITIGSLVGLSGILILTLIRDASHPWMLHYYALALGVGTGLCSPTITATVTDVFQGRHVGATIGAVWLSFAVGGAIGPWLGGWVFEVTGFYRAAFFLAMFSYGVACVAVWLAAPRKVRLVAGRVKPTAG